MKKKKNISREELLQEVKKSIIFLCDQFIEEHRNIETFRNDLQEYLDCVAKEKGLLPKSLDLSEHIKIEEGPEYGMYWILLSPELGKLLEIDTFMEEEDIQ